MSRLIKKLWIGIRVEHSVRKNVKVVLSLTNSIPSTKTLTLIGSTNNGQTIANYGSETELMYLISGNSNPGVPKNTGGVENITGEFKADGD